MKRLGYRLLGIFSLGALLVAVGCTVTTSVVDFEYEGCVPGDSCSGGTICEATEFAAFSGNMCTHTCISNADCPPDNRFDNAVVLCVINAGSSSGQCYLDCSAIPCKDNTSCRNVDGVAICLP
jgi:hypothetical protein